MRLFRQSNEAALQWQSIVPFWWPNNEAIRAISSHTRYVISHFCPLISNLLYYIIIQCTAICRLLQFVDHYTCMVKITLILQPFHIHDAHQPRTKAQFLNARQNKVVMIRSIQMVCVSITNSCSSYWGCWLAPKRRSSRKRAPSKGPVTRSPAPNMSTGLAPSTVIPAATPPAPIKT